MYHGIYKPRNKVVVGGASLPNTVPDLTVRIENYSTVPDSNLRVSK